MISAKYTYRSLLIAATLIQSLPPFVFGGSNHFPSSADTSVLATVGGHAITVNEFRESYEFGPSFVKHCQDPKATHLQYLINEKLIALDGHAHGIDTAVSVRRMLKEIEDDLAVAEWYRRELAPLVHVDSSRIRRGIEEKAVGLTFRTIFTDNDDNIRSIKTLLDSGLSFDSLFTSLREDPAFSLKEMTEDFFTVHERDSHVAETLARMKPGTCSGIIKATSGFSLLRLDHAKKNLITTATEYERMWSKVARYCAKHMLDSITVSYTRGLLEECPPTISGEALKATLRLFSDATVKSQFSEQHEMGRKELAHSEIVLQEDLGSETLVKSACDRFTTKEFAVWYSYRRFKVDFSKLRTSTLQSVKDLIFTMVRDKRMIKVAHRKGYRDDPSVQFEMNKWKTKMSYWKQKSSVLKQPAFTDEEVQRFYADNKQRYEKDVKGMQIAYEQAKAKVKNDLILYEYNKQLFQYLNTLKQQYPVRVDEALLRSLHVSDESLPKKMDLVILKKGGTLPRRAFPTIDNEWQFFR